MYVLLTNGAEPSRLCELLHALGVEAERDGGVLRLTGDIYRIDTAWFRAQSGVAGVVLSDSMAPLCSRTDADTVVSVGDASFGGGHFGIIAGPCAVESAESIDRCAAMVARCGGRILRGGAFKPRTSPYHYQGMGEEGLRLLSQSAIKYGLRCAAELMSPEDCEKLSDYVDIVQIGARNMQNFPLLRAAGQLRKPVILKRGFCATQEEWLLAAEYVLCGGNSQLILCERGIRTFESAQRFTLDLGAVAALKQKTHLPVIVDPSHAAGTGTLVEPLALSAVAAGADGLMLEAHPSPETALCDGLQALDEPALARVMHRASELHSHLNRS